jgi:hypothetical protein
MQRDNPTPVLTRSFNKRRVIGMMPAGDTGGGDLSRHVPPGMEDMLPLSTPFTNANKLVGREPLAAPSGASRRTSAPFGGTGPGTDPFPGMLPLDAKPLSPIQQAVRNTNALKKRGTVAYLQALGPARDPQINALRQQRIAENEGGAFQLSDGALQQHDVLRDANSRANLAADTEANILAPSVADVNASTARYNAALAGNTDASTATEQALQQPRARYAAAQADRAEQMIGPEVDAARAGVTDAAGQIGQMRGVLRDVTGAARAAAASGKAPTPARRMSAKDLQGYFEIIKEQRGEAAAQAWLRQQLGEDQQQPGQLSPQVDPAQGVGGAAVDLSVPYTPRPAAAPAAADRFAHLLPLGAGAPPAQPREPLLSNPGARVAAGGAGYSALMASPTPYATAPQPPQPVAGRPITRSIAQQIFREAGGDPEKAKRIAEARGYDHTNAVQ